MKNKDHIDHEVQRTMHSLDNMERAKTDAFFYSRLQSKLQHETLQTASSPGLGFAFSVAAVILIIILNISTILIGSAVFSEEAQSSSNYPAETYDEYRVFDLNYYNQLEDN